MTTARINPRPTSNTKQQDRLSGGLSACRKSMFFQKKCLFSIPIRTLCGLCVLQSLWAFYLGILAETPNPFPRERGYITGATAPDQAKMLAVSHKKPLHDAVAQMADDLYGGYAPKQGCFGCLPKVLHDAKPTEQAISDTPFFIIKRFINRLQDRLSGGLFM